MAKDKHIVTVKLDTKKLEKTIRDTLQSLDPDRMAHTLYREGQMAHAPRKHFLQLTELLTKLFPGLYVTNCAFTHDAREGCSMSLEMLLRDPALIANPESVMDPDIVAILRAEVSAGELREDED